LVISTRIGAIWRLILSATRARRHGALPERRLLATRRNLPRALASMAPQAVWRIDTIGSSWPVGVSKYWAAGADPPAAPFIKQKESTMDRIEPQFVAAFLDWRDAPGDRRGRLLRKQAADDALTSSLSASFRRCRELSEDELRRLIAPNGLSFGECTGAQRSEIAEWVTGLTRAARAQAAVVETLARASAHGVKIWTLEKWI
jgi:hypothetical protein